ncbi:MAG: hypothetical protein GY861_15155 [bacterium]|nr:hypothetical protein [bacterium]
MEEERICTRCEELQLLSCLIDKTVDLTAMFEEDEARTEERQLVMNAIVEKRRNQKDQIEVSQTERVSQRQRQLQKKIPMSNIVEVSVKEVPKVSMKESSVEMDTSTPEDESICHVQL